HRLGVVDDDAAVVIGHAMDAQIVEIGLDHRIGRRAEHAELHAIAELVGVGTVLTGHWIFSASSRLSNIAWRSRYWRRWAGSAWIAAMRSNRARCDSPGPCSMKALLAIVWAWMNSRVAWRRWRSNR